MEAIVILRECIESVTMQHESSGWFQRFRIMNSGERQRPLPGFNGTFNSCRHHAAGTSAAKPAAGPTSYQATRLTGHLQIFLINFG